MDVKRKQEDSSYIFSIAKNETLALGTDIRVITVADKGMTTGGNIWYTTQTPTKDGYVFSMSVRGADKELKGYIMDESGYEWLGSEYKRKSRLYPRTIQVTTADGKKMRKTMHEKLLSSTA